MRNYIKNATRGVAFLFDVIKDLIKIHVNIFTFRRTKSARRFLAGIVALVFIFATLLSDVSIAYAQADMGAIPVEKGTITGEITEDEKTNENITKENTTESETESVTPTPTPATPTPAIPTPAPVTPVDVEPTVEVIPSVTPVPVNPEVIEPTAEVTPSVTPTIDKKEDEEPIAEVSPSVTPTDDKPVVENSSDENTSNEEFEVEMVADETATDDELSDETELDEDKASENMPAISLVKTVDDYEISIECSEGTFADGTTVEIKKVEGEAKKETDKLVEEAVEENSITEDIEIVKIVSFDITFYDKDGKEVEPADKNSVSVKIVPSEQDKEELENVDVSDDQELACAVFHIEDDKNVEEIECKVDDPVEEVIFEAESFSTYSIAWYKNGVESSEGPEEIGGYIKTTHTFIDFTIPFEFINEGKPVDKTLRPKELVFDIYGRDATGIVGVDDSEVKICQVKIPIENYTDSTKKLSFKHSGSKETDIPLYVVKGTQAMGQNGDASYNYTGFEYTIKFVGMDTSIYSVAQDTTGIKISHFSNEREWSAEGTETLVAQRETLKPNIFYLSWIDNKNKAGKRPYSALDDITDEQALKDSIKLYRQVEGGSLQEVTDAVLPIELDKTGPIVGRRGGESISDWEITYNNLPTVDSVSGKSVKYYITVDDSEFKENYTTEMPEGSVSVDGKQAFVSGSTAKYIYSEDFTATVEWYDNKNEHGIRLAKLDLIKEFVITDDKDEKILFTDSEGKINFKGEVVSDTDILSIVRITEKGAGDEWDVKVGPLSIYNDQGDERAYKLVVKDGVIKRTGSDDHDYEYSVDYSNIPKTTAHENCLSGGKVILVIDRPLDSFEIHKIWSDSNDYERREDAVEAGVRFLLWRYPSTKVDSEGNQSEGKPIDRAAVFNPETHAQYSYTLKMDKPNVIDSHGVKDDIKITLAEFGVTDEHPVDYFDQNGFKYVYFATEVMSKTGYKTVYTDVGSFADYAEYGVMHGGTMKNIRQEKMKMEGIVKWNVPSVNDYANATVTIALQKYDGVNWVTLPSDEGKVYTKTLSGFTVTKPTASYIFPEVERYDENGDEIKYRIVQTNVNYGGVDIPLVNTDTHESDPDISKHYKEFISDEYDMSGKNYTAYTAPTPEKDDSYTIENRLAGDMVLKLTKFWRDNGSEKGYGKTDCEPYQNITINVFQHGTSKNYLEPYMTITTVADEDDVNFKAQGALLDGMGVSSNEIPVNIHYTDPSKDVEGKVIVTRNSEDRAEKWEFKKVVDGELVDIDLPAFNENGNAYSYTVEESHVNKAYTTYLYERTGNELSANVTNKYVDGGGHSRTVIFQKEWIDGTDIPQEKPVKIAIVRIKPDGSFYTVDGKINLEDKNGKTHIVTLTENNNWYGQLDINLDDFDQSEADTEKYLYTAIELGVARSGSTDSLRDVNYDIPAIEGRLGDDIESSDTCSEITGTIAAFRDESHEENHLPGYDVTVIAPGTSVVGASKYDVVNKRKGTVNVVFNKTWQDGSNSEGTRTGIHRVYLYQNGKKVVTSPDPSNDKETGISGIISPDEKEYTEGIQDNENSFSFMGLPQYDDDGNMYHYTVKEFLEKDDKEIEIALTDTKDSTKSGYIVSNYSETTHFDVSVSDNSILERNDTYEYTNTVTGEKTGGVKFYVLWHDQSSYDKGIRPDVNYVLYYKTKGSLEEPKIYNGEYKAEWHPMYDADVENPSIASRYYQYVNFTKLPLANDEGVPYEYYAVPSLNNPGDHYDEAYFKTYKDVIPAVDGAGNHILTSAGRYHYDLQKEAAKLTSNMLPEDGIVEYTIDETIHIKGNKLWKLNDNGKVDTSELPDAKIYLWRESDHDKEKVLVSDVSKCLAETELNDDKSEYAFETDGKPDDYPKYDKYGQVYKYTVSEKIFINSEEQKYTYSIPDYVMNYKPETNGITNVYNPVNRQNLRSFKVMKDWGGLTLGPNDNHPVAEFRLYRVEVPLNAGFYKTETISDNTILSVNPNKDAYAYAIDKFKAGDAEVVGTKSIKHGDSDYAVWEDMPIYASSGLVYLYIVEELNAHGLESFKYGVITHFGSTCPDVEVYDAVDTDAGRTNILINNSTEDSAEPVRAGAVLFSNYGLAPSMAEDELANQQETAYRNSLNEEKINKIVGYKTWGDGIFKDEVRPEINGPDVTLKLSRSAAAQDGYGNKTITEDINPSLYNVTWSLVDDYKWKFEITPTESAVNEFKLYAKNGRPYTYTVTESMSGDAAHNYTIARKTVTVTGSESNVKDNTMTIASSLQNNLKGQVKVFKKWNDALNELNLRSAHVNVVLQYRLVPNTANEGEYTESDETTQWKTYRSAAGKPYEVYKLEYNNKWEQTVKNLPVESKVIDGVKYRYEYRLLETEFYDLKMDLHPIIIDDSGNALNGISNNKIPDGGLCVGSSKAGRDTLYGNSTSPDENYHNKSYEVKIGNYLVNNSKIARLGVNTTATSNMELRVDNRLVDTVSLRVEKKWDGVNIGEATGTPVDTYGILPDTLTFSIEYKTEDAASDAWKPLEDGHGNTVTVTVNRDEEDNSFGITYTNLNRAELDKNLIYRAVEVNENLGRFDFAATTYEYDPAVIDPNNNSTVCHTIVTNKLPNRDITVKKRWNAEEDLRKEIEVELYSDNFTTSGEKLSPVNNTLRKLKASEGWEATYKNLPVYNTKHEEIHYYLKEVTVGGSDFDATKYAIHFFDQTAETSYHEVTERHDDINVAPIPQDAYKMYIVNTPKTSLKVTKKWNDENDRQGKREPVSVTLSNDGEFSIIEATKILGIADKSYVKWDYLPIYKKPDVNFVKGSMASTDKVNYTVTEAATLRTKGYEAPEYSFDAKSTVSDNGNAVKLNGSDNEATITNTYHPPRIRFTASKKWDDKGNRHLSRPDQQGIYLTLYYSTDKTNWSKVENPPSDYKGGNYPNGSKVYTISKVTQHVTDNSTDIWGTPVWEGLPTKVSKKAIYYKAFETDESGNIQVTPGYSASYSQDGINVESNISGDEVSQVVTNELKTTSMLVSKEWENSYDVTDRPDSVTFVLEYRCGAMDWRVYRKDDGSVLKVTLTGADHKSGLSHIWEKKIDKLPFVNGEGVRYEYRVKEISIAYGTDEVLAYGITSDEISSSIFKHDGDSWTSESTVGAFKNSVVVKPYEVTKDSDYGYKVTAVNTPITGKLTVTKKWDDENNRDGLRPKEIRLQLYRKQDQVAPVQYGGVVVVGPGKTGTTVVGNEWTYTFDKLPVYNNDAYEHTEANKSIYYVKEVDHESGYDVSYTSESGVTADEFDGADNILNHNSDNTYSTSEIVTNKHTPVRINITAHKEWKDNDNNQHTRPATIEFMLQYRIDGEGDDWQDVATVSPSTDGTTVETTSALVRTLTRDALDTADNWEKWEKDTEGKPVVWENLPAYVNVIKGDHVEYGKRVEYRLLESDSASTPADKTVMDHYRVHYTQCDYRTEYGTDYSLKVTNILKGANSVLEIDKNWDPECKDDIAEGDMVISKIKCHLLQKSKATFAFGEWELHQNFELTHEDNWQYIFDDLTSEYRYKVVEDVIVYKKADGTEVSVYADAPDSKNIGSFVWKAISDKGSEIIEGTGDNAEMKATITNEIPNKSITVSKVWEDEHDREGKRPKSITVRLLRDGKKVGEDVVLDPLTDQVDDPWETHTWNNLPIYKNGTKDLSVYTVVEVLDAEADAKFIEAYTEISYSVGNGVAKSACDGITFEATKPSSVEVKITNRHEVHKETITATKTWVDENNKYKSRPKKLFGDYHTYLMLLYKIDGQDKWEPINTYPDYADFEKRGYQYKDHHIYTTSPAIQEITGGVEADWSNKISWENVSTRGVDVVGQSDQDVAFKVIEVPGPDYLDKFLTDPNNSVTDPVSIAPKGYTASKPQKFDPEIDGNTIEFAYTTNTLITTSLEVEKTWEDYDNKFATRPDAIKVKLERKLKKYENDSAKKWQSVEQIDKDDTELEISASNDWKDKFDGLPVYDQEGNEFIYRAVETALIYGETVVTLDVTDEPDYGKKVVAEGGNYTSKMYSSSVGSALDPATLKYTVSMNNILMDSDGDTTSLTVIKKWKDENNRDRIRPGSVTVNLLRDGVKVDTQIITGPSWQYTWNKLPVYQNGESKGLFGNKSVYTVTEEAVAGYEATIAKSADKQYTITNTHIPKKAVITADKLWEDSDDTYSTRPKEIYLRLVYKYADESDSAYRVVPEYSKEEFEEAGMYTSDGAEGVFTTSKATQKCTGKDNENWLKAAKWENLPITATPNGTEYEPKPVVYKVIEVLTPDADSALAESEGAPGYEATSTILAAENLKTDVENIAEITNSLITTELNITKTFEDGDNKYNTRPDSIEVQILRRIKTSSNDSKWQPVKVKGGLFGDDLTTTLTKAEGYSKKLADLPKYNKDGSEYEYTCLEKVLIFGDKKISADKSNVTATYKVSESETAITNTLITTSLTVEKTWKDNSNKRKSRPEKIVFTVERKETKDILSEVISKLTKLFTGIDGYSELKMLKDGKEETVEIVIDGPEFKPFTLEGLPAYSEEGYLYSYRAIETKLVYAKKEVLVQKGTSLYKKPTYKFNVIESGKDAKGNTAYKYSEEVVNKIIPIKEDTETQAPEEPGPSNPVSPVTPSPVKPPSKYEILDDVDPNDPTDLPKKVTDKINELIDLPDDEVNKQKIQQLYNDLLLILQDDPAFLDKLDLETADIVRRFLQSGVLGRKRSRLPKTGGVVGSVMLLILGAMFIGAGVALRPEDESDKKKRRKSDKKA